MIRLLGKFRHDPGLNSMASFVVNIRFNSLKCFPVTITADKTILDLKTLIAEKLDVTVKDLRIILAGHSLKDDLKINDFDIGNHSVLHALEVRQRVDSVSLPSETPGGAACGGDDGPPSGEHPEAAKKQFYVYCKGCQSIRSGKLRVKCGACGNGVFLVDRGPSGWEDVLRENRITGECQLSECRGRHPKFYFRCGFHESSSVDETAIPLHHIKPNSRLVECITCSDTSALVLVFPCAPGHVMCLDCFNNYCVTRLNNRTFVSVEPIGYTLPCPAGCQDSYIQEVHHFRLLGDDQYERYQRFSTEQYVLAVGGVLCPRPGCGNGLMPDEASRRVSCPADSMGCGFEFCKLCLEKFHEGSCDMVPLQAPMQDDIAVDEEMAQRSRWEVESREVIERTTKPCPQCRVKTEHSGGCMHLNCSQCKFQWCWLCSKQWSFDCQGAHWFG